jgi:hypothetical protein
MPNMPNTRDVHRKASQMRTSIMWRNLPSKAEEVVNVLEVSLASVRSILKECICIRFAANLYPSCWVRHRGELCQHMPGPSREAWNLEFCCMIITGDETVVVSVTQKPSNGHLGGGTHHLPCPQERYVCSDAIDMFVMSICTEHLVSHWMDFEWNLSIFKKIC